MSNPTTLQELADSLAVSAQSAYQKLQDDPSWGVYGVGYREALLDTRATVLAMIASGREVIRTVHVWPPADDKMVRYQYQVLVDGTPMQHGPFDPTSARHPRSAAAIYQDINPEATVTIQYRDNEDDGVWTTTEPVQCDVCGAIGCDLPHPRFRGGA